MRADMLDACTREGADEMEREATSLQFWVASETWFASRDFFGNRGRREVVEEVWFGRYGEGARWEAAFRWHDLSDQFTRRHSPRVEMFDDAWEAFAECPTLFADLATLHGKDPQPPEIIALLQRHGFTDKTERHDHAGRPSHERIRGNGLALYDALREAAPSHPALAKCEAPAVSP